MKKYHFITGLPRSGTTLLSTILNQNPMFEASISSPLARFARSVIQEASSQGGYGTECPEEKRKSLIKGLFENYYPDKEKSVAFNTNRGWSFLLPLVKDLYPYAKIIVCVRDIAWVLDSFERLVAKNPYTASALFSADESVSVYSRCETLLNPGRTLGFAYMGVKQAISSDYKSSLFLLEYENLARNPETVMRALYNFIDQPYFDHDYNDVGASYPEFDDEVQLQGLHTTRNSVEFIPRSTVIPLDILARVQGMEVWRG
jgi:sulfotransferase